MPINNVDDLFKQGFKFHQQGQLAQAWQIYSNVLTTQPAHADALYFSGLISNPNRLVFAPRMKPEEHLARHRAADLFLDTLTYNAHTTASDALWTGLPVLTKTGQSFAARVAASLLSAMQLPELITQSDEEYERRAIELAINPFRHAEFKNKIDQNRLTSPLFNGQLFASHIELAFTEIHRLYICGEKPEHIDVENLTHPPSS